MPLSHEHVGSKIPAKIQIYILTRAELLITLCYEIPCNILYVIVTSIEIVNFQSRQKVKKEEKKNSPFSFYGTLSMYKKRGISTEPPRSQLTSLYFGGVAAA